MIKRENSEKHILLYSGRRLNQAMISVLILQLEKSTGSLLREIAQQKFDRPSGSLWI